MNCTLNLLHAQYSPDFAPSVIFFPVSKPKEMKEIHFKYGSHIAKLYFYFKGLERLYYTEGIRKFEYRHSKCIELTENYIEK